jgi:hypothetical protein
MKGMRWPSASPGTHKRATSSGGAAAFDAETGAVRSAPAPRPLPRHEVVERDAQTYAL